MAEDLRSEYMAVAAAQNARGLQRIKAFQRFFQNDGPVFLQTKMDRRVYKGAMAFSVAAIGIALFSIYSMATGKMKPKRD